MRNDLDFNIFGDERSFAESVARGNTCLDIDSLGGLYWLLSCLLLFVLVKAVEGADDDRIVIVFNGDVGRCGDKSFFDTDGIRRLGEFDLDRLILSETLTMGSAERPTAAILDVVFV